MCIGIEVEVSQTYSIEERNKIIITCLMVLNWQHLRMLLYQLYFDVEEKGGSIVTAKSIL
jgi:hypothetical protein